MRHGPPQGVLSISVSGLLAGAPAPRTVTGPSEYRRAVSSSIRLHSRVVGDYVLHSGGTTDPGDSDSPTVDSQSVHVSAGDVRTDIALVALFPGLLLFFGLDFLQSRRMVPDANLKSFTLVGVKTAGFAGWLGLMLLWADWRALQPSRRLDEGDGRAKRHDLLVGQE